MSSYYQELPWVESVLDDENVPKEIRTFLELFDGELQLEDTSVYRYITKNMKGVVSSPAVLKNLKRGALPPVYCLRYFSFLEESEVDYLEWFMVNKNHITRKKYLKNNVDDIFDKWEGKPAPETTLRFSSEKENKSVRRMRRKHQSLKYLQRAYELGV